MVGGTVPGWRLLWFVALRRLTPLGITLVAAGLFASLALPLRLAPARTFTMRVTVPGLERASSLAAIEVSAGGCPFAEATPSPTGTTALALPAGDYTVAARMTTDAREAGWALAHVAVHLDRDLDVDVGDQIGASSGLAPMRAAPAPHCPAP